MISNICLFYYKQYTSNNRSRDLRRDLVAIDRIICILIFAASNSFLSGEVE